MSFDFATSQLPGWHTTIFPPYFVAGAIFSGFAMVLTLLIPLRYLFNLQAHHQAGAHRRDVQDHAGDRHDGRLAYATEFFIAWYSGNAFEQFTFLNRAFGPFWWAYFMMVSCNVLVPQFFWSKWVRNNNS